MRIQRVYSVEEGLGEEGKYVMSGFRGRGVELGIV